MIFRGFFALPLPEAARDTLDRYRVALEPQLRAVGARARFVPPEHMHVTLAFLGDVSREAAPALAGAAGALARGLPPFQTTVDALTAFPGPQRARVLVLGVRDDAGLIARLADGCRDAGAAVGVHAEDRAFRPHVTLGRLRAPRDLRAVIADAPPLTLPLAFDRVILFESSRTDAGHRYLPLGVAPLGR